MKLFLAIFFSLFACNLLAQDKFSGDYYNYFGSELKLKPDSTFEYRWRLEQASSWTNGTWKTKKDTIFLKMVPVYDTVWVNPTTIRLYLSLNERGQKVAAKEQSLRPGTTEGQNQHPAPEKLFLQGTRLYGIERNGSLQKTKVQGYRTERKFDPWYMKVEGK
ncbi:hypothetical protein I5M27_03985 [Adhaeribacter sp. BT258]|uniref:Uncharacterized protein n=1 Tax=Adhaeribacter terrigena TaxID=2793070 RepID=A0ABS1BY89_9BACT|nr:hypothetical protein [Adhaeribacter terrigena]MBK0402130.1 hypothetical protein [Adhaeribacter terrigena]